MDVFVLYLRRAWRRKAYLIAFFIVLTGLLYALELTTSGSDNQHNSVSVNAESESLPFKRLDDSDEVRSRLRVLKAQGEERRGVRFLPAVSPDRKLPFRSHVLRGVNVQHPVPESRNNMMVQVSGDIRQLPAAFDEAEYDQPGKFPSHEFPSHQHLGHRGVARETPYIPQRRLVHFDLKGAPPKLSYLIQVVKLSAKLGATGILLEYEDMFPFQGQLAPAAASNHYSRSEIVELLDACRQLKMEVIPLVQTFGHMEFILKLREFSHLRDNEAMPESICSCHEQTMPLIKTYIDQVMALHPDVKHLHIGCDEVYHMGECPPCASLGKSRAETFVKHVERVARYAKTKHRVNVIVWNDMLTNLMEEDMMPLAPLVEPMIWVYAEEVYNLMPSYNFDRLANVFSTAWAASAFKGAHGPTLMVPPVEKHLTNTLSWLNVMSKEAPKFKDGFQGLVSTGWQRYDHFAVLCEILPVAIPSLAVSLIAIEHGYFNGSLLMKLYDGLSCATGGNLNTGDRYSTSLNLEEDPFLWSKMLWCSFPGAQAFKLTEEVDRVRGEIEDYLHKVKTEQGWLTDFNVRRNYSSPFRVDEVLEGFKNHVYTLSRLFTSAKRSLEPFFDSYTVAEWIEQRIYPAYRELQQLKQASDGLRKRRQWTRRPFGINEALREFGIGIESKSSSGQGAQDKNQRRDVGRKKIPLQTGRPQRLVQRPDFHSNPKSVVIGP